MTEKGMKTIHWPLVFQAEIQQGRRWHLLCVGIIKSLRLHSWAVLDHMWLQLSLDHNLNSQQGKQDWSKPAAYRGARSVATGHWKDAEHLVLEIEMITSSASGYRSPQRHIKPAPRLLELPDITAFNNFTSIVHIFQHLSTTFNYFIIQQDAVYNTCHCNLRRSRCSAQRRPPVPGQAAAGFPQPVDLRPQRQRLQRHQDWRLARL